MFIPFLQQKRSVLLDELLNRVQLVLSKSTLPFQSHDRFDPELSLPSIASHMHMRWLINIRGIEPK
jgi:hypothetical protein